MAFKFVCFAALVAAVSAGVVPVSHYGAAPALHYAAAPAVHYGAPIAVAKYAVPVHKTIIAEPEAPAVYDFAYSVEDHHTGDVKNQQESRKDDVVHGQYSLIEADGVHRRNVAYSGDHHSGLNVDFQYAVEDPHTGDSKSQQESRHGDVVHGSYSLIDADGHRRTVEYTADDHSGFQAVVHREPVQGHVVKAVAPVHHVVKAVAPVAYHAAKVVAPLAYHSAPVAHHVAPLAYHSAPVAHHVAPLAYHSAPVAHVAKVLAPAHAGHSSVSYSAPANSYHY